MNKGVIFTLSFAIGAALGSVATWKIVQKKYENLAKEEIEEVREYYASLNSTEDKTEDNSSEPSEEEWSTWSDKVARMHQERIEYSALAAKYSSSEDKKEGGDSTVRPEPFVISPAEFGEDETFETATLFYYNDGILADSDNNMIEDIESCIGYESLKHFGEYGIDDTVYVRNTEAMYDYEVLLNDSNFSDIEDV